MATQFHADIVGKPFFPSVREEFQRRRTLNQSDILSNATYEMPFFSISRLNRINQNNTSYDRNNLQKASGRFASLGVVSDDNYDVTFGANEIRTRQRGQFTAPAGIDSVTIEQSDYTFFTIDITFTIPNIDDFEDFKKMWFHFGMPVEIDFGRRKVAYKDIRDGDATPFRQKMSGILAKFSYETQGNRSITGSFKIYSMNFLFLQDEAKNDSVEQQRFYNKFKEYIQSVVDYKDRRVDESSESEIEINSNRLFAIVSKTRELSTPDPTPKRDLNIVYSQGMGGVQVPNLLTTRELALPEPSLKVRQSKQLPIGTIVNEEYRINEISSPQSNLPTLEELQYYKSYQIKANRLTGNTLGFNVLLSERDDVIISLPEAPTNGGRVVITTTFIEKRLLQRIEEKIRNLNSVKSLSSNIVQQFSTNNRSIIKELLSSLSIEQDKWNTDVYFYISMGAIQEFINEFLSRITIYERARLPQNLRIIRSVDYSETKIKNFERIFGVISSKPDRILFGKPIQETPSDAEEMFLSDVFISIELLDVIAQDSKSVYSFIENIITEINSASMGITNLSKANLSNIEQDNFILGSVITYIDTNNLNISENSTDYYKFDLYNPAEKIKNVNVQTSISENLEQYAFFNTLSSVDVENKAVFSATNTYGVSMQDQLPPDIDFVDRLSNTINKLISEPNYVESRGANQEIGTIKTDEINLMQQTLNGIQVSGLKSYIEGRDETLKTNFLYFYAYINRFVELQRQLLFMEDSSVFGTNIPLQVSFDVDGIAGIIPAQCFRLSNKSFPIAYDLDEIDAYSYFIVNSLSHSFQQNKWDTSISGLLYLTTNGKRQLLEQSTNGQLQLKKQEVRSRIVTLSNILLETLRNEQ